MSEAVAMAKTGAQERIEAMMAAAASGKVAGQSAAVFSAKADRAAIGEMLANATLPREAGDVTVAPARGPMKVVPIFVANSGGTRRIDGYRAEALDVFDRMTNDARARHEKQIKALRMAKADPDKDPIFREPFTPGQIAMARHYRDLIERHSAGGVKCSSLETRSGGGSGGDFIEAYAAEGDEIKALQRKIGTGQAMVLRRIRPSERGSRGSIMDRRLVDMVCIEDLSLSEVLERHGWTVATKYLAALRTALCGSLDRMQGYRDARSAK